MIKEELELKLAAAPDEFERLCGDDLIRFLDSKQARTTRLRTNYFDTPAYDLRRRGMALRVRQVSKRHVHTLKVPNRDGSGLQHYRGYETQIEADEPDVGRIEDAALRRLFDDQGLGRGLRPTLTPAVSRRSVPLKLADNQVTLDLDSGEVLADGKRMPISEAELELVSGSGKHIYELALTLLSADEMRLAQITGLALRFA